MKIYRLIGSIFVIPVILIGGICHGIVECYIVECYKDILKNLIVVIKWIKEE